MCVCVCTHLRALWVLHLCVPCWHPSGALIHVSHFEFEAPLQLLVSNFLLELRDRNATDNEALVVVARVGGYGDTVRGLGAGSAPLCLESLPSSSA